MPSSRALLVFAKAPVSGAVKTRLLPAVSAEAAAEIHKACIQDTLLLAHAVPACDLFLFVAGSLDFFEAEKNRSQANPDSQPAPRFLAQRGSGLGERLEDAFRQMFERGYRSVIVIGTDTPWMGAASISRAFDALADADVVLGPCPDGGYYLLGSRRYFPQLFRGITWGTKRVMEETLHAIASLGASRELLPIDFDLDLPEDLEQAAALLRAAPHRAPRLAALLACLHG